MIKNLFIFLIFLYQKAISPDHSLLGRLFFPFGLCQYKKTCSEYLKEKIQTYPLPVALYLGFKRVLSCNPLFKGFYE